MKIIAHVGLAAILVLGTMAPGGAGENWTLTHDIALLSKSPTGSRLRDEKITADLYRPKVSERVPAAVIINSGGGVSIYRTCATTGPSRSLAMRA